MSNKKTEIIYAKDKSALKFIKDRKKSMRFLQRVFDPRFHYDKDYDILLIYFNGKGKFKRKYKETAEITEDIRFDFDSKQNIIGIEIEDFSKKIKEQ
jgi:uncharacterized protein YuzE